jgi:hypothetical protein
MDAIFQVHRLNETGLAKAQSIAEQFDALLTALETDCLPAAADPSAPRQMTREFALVKTHLESACFYAKKSIANQIENQLASQ